MRYAKCETAGRETQRSVDSREIDSCPIFRGTTGGGRPVPASTAICGVDLFLNLFLKNAITSLLFPAHDRFLFGGRVTLFQAGHTDILSCSLHQWKTSSGYFAPVNTSCGDRLSSLRLCGIGGDHEAMWVELLVRCTYAFDLWP